MITNVHLHKQDCVIFFLKFRFFPFASFSVKKKKKKKGIIPYPVDEKLCFVMPPRATVVLSFYEFVWYQGWALRVPTQIFFPMTLLLKAFISSLWQKIDYYPWHLMDSFHKSTFLFWVFCAWVCKVFLGRLYFLERKKNQATTTYFMEYSCITAMCEKVGSEVTILLPCSFFHLNTRKIYIHTAQR